MNEGFVKRANRKSMDDMRPECDFASMKGGVRRKYVDKYRAGTNLALVDPDLALAFPTDAAVNQALRVVLSIGKVVRLPHKTLQRKAQRRHRH